MFFGEEEKTRFLPRYNGLLMNIKKGFINTCLCYFAIFLTGIFFLSSCKSPNATPASDKQVHSSLQATLPPLPAVYQAQNLNPLDTPRTYINDTCRYLRNKWNPANSEPGTLVMIIKVGEIFNGLQNDKNGINLGQFDKAMQELKTQGFTAITMKDFLFFLERNFKIPQRSILVIQDGNYGKDYFYKYFRDYWEEWKWPVINGWISDPNMTASSWVDNIALENEIWVDHQPQGVIPGSVLSDDSSKAVITRELEGSLTAFANRFNKTPYAIIWPGGGFGFRPVTAARQLGYELGFTANSRGPVMYNWIPLADQADPARPDYIPEGPINDPLMTLPRYSPDQILGALDSVRSIGDQAADYAQANKPAEIKYYHSVCSSTYGPILSR